ncbi:putative porin [Oceanisphaera litoralis]|uniref:hypothetical protein n=1 Tax=Oceanisphaera litoralis TaxID=225144 RepID=UPI001956F7AD|nr:hypothetical protein [Oceanisphaera litoralis]MBM7456407.1 putative porin [Oceanisphaera litoralis]
MTKKSKDMTPKKLSLAIMLAVVSTSASALELGEFNGTRLSLGGYVKAEGILDSPDDAEDSFQGTVRQSRLNFTAAKEVEGHQVKGFIEGDFWGGAGDDGGSTYDWRLRHAFVTVDNITLGQTWNGQFHAILPVDVEVLNFWGPMAGTIAGSGAVVRPDLLMHYTWNGLRLTLQDPVYTDADFPDMVASYTHRTESGHAFNVAVTGRDVNTNVAPKADAPGEGTLISAGDGSKFAAAISLGGKLKLGNTALSLTGYTGEGVGVYTGMGYQGSKGGLTSDVNADGELITTTGFSTGITQKFSDKLRGTVRYGQVKADEVAAGFNDTLQMTNVNLIYTYLPGLEFGIEWRDQNQTTIPASAGDNKQRLKGEQVEVMAMYRF